MSGTKSDYVWKQLVHRVTTSGTTSDNEWHWLIQRVTTNNSGWKQIKQSDFKFKNETKTSLVPESFYSTL